MPTRERIVLVHGAATTARIWDKVYPFLGDFDVVVPDRPMSGALHAELAFLEPLCAGAWVVGVSGGATLGLALAAEGVPMSGAVLHEPAAGSLVPHLLDAVAAAYRDGGVEGFGATLYGDAWSLDDAPADCDAVARDLAMFRGFEPRRPAGAAGPVLLTVGADSPAVRHEVHAALTTALGVEGQVLPAARHAVHLEAPETFARSVAAQISRIRAPAR
jgi:pimeloyl-ACP methyl ester carboxylesterase